jgi:hypothetical protein
LDDEGGEFTLEHDRTYFAGVGLVQTHGVLEQLVWLGWGRAKKNEEVTSNVLRAESNSPGQASIFFPKQCYYGLLVSTR